MSYDPSEYWQTINLSFHKKISDEEVRKEIEHQVSIRLFEVYQIAKMSKVEPKHIRLDVEINQEYPDGER